jgi:putative protease
VRILCPVDRADEVDRLVDAGAGELYAGVVPPSWEGEYGPLVTPTRRTFAAAHASGLDEFGRIAAAAAGRGVPVFAVLNVSPVPDRMIAPLLAHAEDLVRAGAAGLIVADPGLLAALAARPFHAPPAAGGGEGGGAVPPREGSPGGPVHRALPVERVASHVKPYELVASTLFSVFNGAAAAFLARAGATRVVLPRELSADELCALAGESSLPVEAVAMRGRCPNVEGFCTHLHDDPERTWPCELRYAKEWRGAGEGIPPFVERALSRDEGTDRHFSCGLCAVPILAAGGVHALKVVGRGAETERKVEAVAAVAAMLAWGEGAAPSSAECARRGKELYRRLHGRPCRRENCYFPEFSPEGEGEP